MYKIVQVHNFLLTKETVHATQFLVKATCMRMHWIQINLRSKLESISIPELWDVPGMAYQGKVTNA